MKKNTLIQISPKKLAELISTNLKKELQKIAVQPKVQELNSLNRPHLTRKETAAFFDVSLNCINDWCKKGILEPIKVGQRTYFKKSDLLRVLFGQ